MSWFIYFFVFFSRFLIDFQWNTIFKPFLIFFFFPRRAIPVQNRWTSCSWTGPGRVRFRASWKWLPTDCWACCSDWDNSEPCWADRRGNWTTGPVAPGSTPSWDREERANWNWRWSRCWRRCPSGWCSTSSCSSPRCCSNSALQRFLPDGAC